MQKFPITSKGYEKILQELRHLKSEERPKIIEAIASAREQGDLSENADYQAAREKQGFIEGRIQELEDKISRSEIIEVEKLTGNSIKFGATLKIVDCDTNKESIYQIVGEYEANLADGLISISSPLAKALIGKSPGDYAEVLTPKGLKEYEIISVKYK